MHSAPQRPPVQKAATTVDVAAAHPADRLMAAIQRCAAPVCVGLDPVLERLPGQLRPGGATPNDETAARALEAFSEGVLESVAGIVPAVKFQSACFERWRGPGFAVLFRLMKVAKQRGLMVIYDGKRGDIGLTAKHYAAAVDGYADWVTANSYLGIDAITPTLEAGLGVFALVRTSNPSGSDIQQQRVADGTTVAEHVAQQMRELAEQNVGACGYSALGAVVGATDCASAEQLRALLRGQIFLVPGFGAQGGGVEDILPCFENGGHGALITASRSVIYAFADGAGPWTDAVAEAARQFADQLGRAAGMRT